MFLFVCFFFNFKVSVYSLRKYVSLSKSVPLGLAPPAAGRFTIGGTMRMAAAEVELQPALPRLCLDLLDSVLCSGAGFAALPLGPSRPASEYIREGTATRKLSNHDSTAPRGPGKQWGSEWRTQKKKT